MRLQRTPFGLRMTEDLQNWVKEKAAEQNRSMNNFINHVLEARRSEETAAQK